MKISLVQLNSKWLDVESNIQTANKLFDAQPQSDLYVLPEMWATGFNTSPTPEMKNMAIRALEWMLQQANDRDCAVAGTLAVCDNKGESNNSTKEETWYNRFFFVFPNQKYVYYDKRNLFTYGGEHKSFTAGTKPLIVTWRKVRFMLQICFDLRFPETARNTLSAPYDVLLYAANWPTSRHNAWDKLLSARAIENQAYCAGVNRTGHDLTNVYSGETVAYDPYGSPLVYLHDEEQAISFEIDLQKLNLFRKNFLTLR